jgi:hypothetical protein
MMFKKIAAAMLVTVGLLTAVSVPQARASTTTCKTVNVSKPYAFIIGPSYNYGLHIPVCYNGQRVWVNGHITPWTLGIGWSLGVTWYGWYNDRSSAWLGTGMNIDVALVLKGSPLSYTVEPRWYIGANGQVYSTVGAH